MLRKIGSILISYAPDNGGGGGGTAPTVESLTAEKDALAKEKATLQAELEKLKKGAKPNAEDDGEGDDLAEKARKARDEKNKGQNDHKALEAALKFDMSSENFLKENEALLGSDIKDIFEAAKKETWTSAVQKEASIKSSLVQTFFKIQAHVDLLTAPLKQKLEDYKKLTKDGKEEKALEMYDYVFGPAFEMLKQLKKAEEIKKGGGAIEDKTQPLWQQNLIKRSRQRYLGEKSQ